MNKMFLLVALSFLFSCTTTKYYIVRHAEKEPATTMSSDVLLTPYGKQRAIALKDQLKGKKISHIYSTNLARTRETAMPLSIAKGVAIENYGSVDTSFLNRLKNLPKGNILIVGHSNTVDDIVNGLTGKPMLKDLDESRYGDLFIVKKRNNHFYFQQKMFGK
ncbi:MAG: histidine phosphatase family protein [Chitinophagaceae bacterium]